jgi:hypothetical protein
MSKGARGAPSLRDASENRRGGVFFPFFFVSPQPGVSNVLLIIMIVLYIRLYRLLARPRAFFTR